MRIGFITSLLWPRYGTYWTRVAADAGAELILAEPDQVIRAAQQRFIREIPSTAFRLATAEAIALADCDLIIVPHPNRDASSTRGGGQNPWIADFPDVLETEAGLQNLFAVPASLGSEAEPLAVNLLQQLRDDGWRTRMIMERHRSLLKPSSRNMPEPARQNTIGVFGQSWLTDLVLAQRAVPEGRHFVAQSEMDPHKLRAEALRTIDGLVPTDLEVLGAVRWFTRRGSISEMIMLVDGASAVDDWLLGQALKLTHKEITAVRIQDVMQGEELGLHLLSRHRKD